MGTAHIEGADLLLRNEIPVIPQSYFAYPSVLIPDEIVGVSIRDIFIGRPIYSEFQKYRTSKNLQINIGVLSNPVFHNKKVILFFDERDVLLEYLWWDRKNLRLFEKLSQIKFYAVTTPNFSVFQGECPVGQALNIKKSLVSGVELEKLGMIVIPHVYAINKRQSERWSCWLGNHPSVKTVAMNCQLQRKRQEDIEIVVAALRHLLLNTETHIILHGGGNTILSPLEEFRERLHIANSGILKKMEITKAMHQTEGQYAWSEEKVPSV